MARADTVTQVNFIKSNILAVDERDQKVWELITDVPKVQKVWAIIIFVLNIIIPGTYLLTNHYETYRPGHDDSELLLVEVQQDSFFRGSLPAIARVRTHRLRHLDLLGSTYPQEGSRGPTRPVEVLG